ncbi:MAG: ribonuclease III family protein [Candidatus Bathyarchaeia archaeon]
MKSSKQFTFTKEYGSLGEVMTDHGLASLGDTYINFIYSLAMSERSGKPLGAKVRGSILAEALKRAGLREHMPSRVSKHAIADAAEALAVYAWLKKHVTLEECVSILCSNEEPVDGLTKLFLVIRDRVKF